MAASPEAFTSLGGGVSGGEDAGTGDDDDDDGDDDGDEGSGSAAAVVKLLGGVLGQCTASAQAQALLGKHLNAVVERLVGCCGFPMSFVYVFDQCSFRVHFSGLHCVASGCV